MQVTANSHPLAFRPTVGTAECLLLNRDENKVFKPCQLSIAEPSYQRGSLLLVPNR